VANQLAGETSPYLLHHADNPVDWYPWGPEALSRARGENKPIFLSIGYSACHWCHVMERESFTDPETAAFLNDHFISIKVDREERPDLDAIYMEAVTALTGRGGWPLSAWLTADGVPFYGGTYFPESPRFGMPSFRQVLEKLVEAWETRRGELDQAAATMRAHLVSGQSQPDERGPGATATPGQIIERALLSLQASLDPVNGGWGGAPKFPQPSVLEALLARLTLGARPELQVMIETTLDAMAAGGIYDQLGGGFHRYATDERWLVPHFEKMLYDNAQLARCYLHAWQVLGKPSYRMVAEETLDYLLREMSHSGGGFFSAQDADSEGREGASFVWTLEEIRRVLTPEEADLAATTYGMTAQGNFEGANILHVVVQAGESPDLMAAARAKLRAARENRVRPARDEKILAGWNGLALAALAEAARALPSQRYREAAERAGDFILRELLRPGYRVFHSWKDGRASGNGFLEDYTCLVEGLLALYQTTFAERWFAAARGLTDAMIECFRRPAGGFYDTSFDHETLITRPRSLQDSPTPSGNSMAAMVLLKMAAYTGENAYWTLAEETLDPMGPLVERAPLAFGNWLSAWHLAAEGLVEVAVVGDADHPNTRALISVVDDSFRPTQIAAARPPGAATIVPLLAGREPPPGGGAAAWVCRRSTCAAPTSDPEELLALLSRSLESV
jgi:uncharacterized protein YyaL (SSP411 family)